MNWIYKIPHLWEPPRTVWEDIYLRPESAAENEPWVHLTVDAIGGAASDSAIDEKEWLELQKDILAKMGAEDYWIDESEEAHLNGTDIYLRAEDFSKEELLLWTRVWLTHKGLAVTEFREVSFFADEP